MSHIYKMDLGRDDVSLCFRVQYVINKVFALTTAKKIQIKAKYEAF